MLITVASVKYCEISFQLLFATNVTLLIVSKLPRYIDRPRFTNESRKQRKKRRNSETEKQKFISN